jgi:integrase
MPPLQRTPKGDYRARKRLPDDVRADYKRLYNQAYEVKLFIPSTVREGEARRRYGDWLSEHEGRVTAIRATQRGEGIDLSRKDALALAGKWYLWFIARHEENPGEPERWDFQFWQLIDEVEKHAPPGFREQSQHDMSWTRDPDVRAGLRPVLADLGHTAQFLASQGITLTNAAHVEFLNCVLENYIEALFLLERRAGGDFSADELPATFPEFTAGKTKANATGLTPWGLFEAWKQARQPSHMTVESWRAVFSALEARFKKPADSVTPDEAQEWIGSLVTDVRSARTVRKTWVGATKAVFRWGKRRKLIKQNPFADVEIDVPRRKRHRETKAFDESELRKILRAASAIADTTRPSDASKRWVPWLLAYTGARPNDITQLRGKDVQRMEGTWAFNLTPEAGTIKTGQARRVPLHEHLIEQGFLAFVETKGQGPLFYRPRKGKPTGQKKPPSAQVRQRLAAWVRSLGVTDTELSPNHGWRHTFKQIATRHGLAEKVIDSICGHAPATEGRGYGEPTLKDKADTLSKFPRYSTDELDT